MRLLAAFLFVLASACAAEPESSTFTLNLPDGRVLEEARVTGQTADAIYVRYREGLVKLFKADLTGRMRETYPTANDIIMAGLERRYAGIQPRIMKGPLMRNYAIGMGEPVYRKWELKFDSNVRNYVFSAYSRFGEKDYLMSLPIPPRQFERLLPLFLRYQELAELARKEKEPAEETRKEIGAWNGLQISFEYNRDRRPMLIIGETSLGELDADAFLALSVQYSGIAAEAASFLNPGAGSNPVPDVPSKPGHGSVRSSGESRSDRDALKR